MLIERRPKLQGYGFRHEAEDDRQGQIFCAKKYPCCRTVHLMALVSTKIKGSRFYYLQEVVFRC